MVNQEYQVREHIIYSLVKWMFFVVIPLLLLSLLRIPKTGWLPVMGLHIFLTCILGVVYWKSEKLTISVRASVIIGIFLLIGIGAIYTNRSILHAAPYMILVGTFSSLFYKNRVTVILVISFSIIQFLMLKFHLKTLDVNDILNLIAQPVFVLLTSYVVAQMKNYLIKAIEQLKENEVEIINTSQARSKFLAMMSHELRTPLNGITLASSHLQDEDLNESAKELVDIIESSSSGLVEVINDILDYSKIDEGKLDLSTSSCKISDVFENVANLMKIHAKEKNIDFIVKNNFSYKGYLKFDEVRLKQILINLLSNAIKFTDKGSVTFILNGKEVDSQKYEIEIKVIDSGIGIKGEDLKLVFEEFKQVDSDKNRRFKGTGLGLVISNNLAQMMGGDLIVESEYGKGSCFMLNLVLTSTNKISSVKTNLNASLLNKSILVAEDNELNKVLLVKTLRKIGFESLDSVKNGIEALEKTAHNHYDLILMDMMMPEMDGLEATKKIRAFNANTPIIALTANSSKEDRDACLKAGMNGFMSKPIHRDKLLSLIIEHLSENRA